MIAEKSATRRDAVPTLSVVTVAYNSADTIGKTLESVAGQTWRDFEHIVVDGGSTDGTLDILKRAGDGIRWKSEPDKGIYDAMNKGIGLARGKWIHLLNSDDYYAGPEVLGAVVEKLREDHLNYCDIVRHYPDGPDVVQRFRFRRWPLYFSAYLPHPGLIVSREQYDKLGLYDTDFRIAADHDFILRMIENYPANHIPVPLTVMLQGGLSGQDLTGSASEFLTVLRKHGLPSILVSAIGLVRSIWWKLRARARQP